MEPNRSIGATAAAADPEMEKRREKRLHVAVPIKLFVSDGANPQHCCTYEISMIGARLVATSGITKVGQVVWLQRQTRRAKYKVIWIGKERTDQAEQVGVELIEAGNVIWENDLKSRILQA